MQIMSYPIVTHLLGAELLEKTKTPKPTARGTGLRYSSAFSCGRQQSYAAYEAEPTEPVDFAGAWVMGMGTLVHEALQEAISRRFPNAEFEVASEDDTSIVSGSCDAYIPASDLGPDWTGGNVLYELKTMGTYSFDKQVGWNRMRGYVNAPEGPALKAIAQAGMNALGIERERGVKIDTILMGSITFEALSKQKAERMGVGDENRVLAEFLIERHEWEPLAQSEIDRMSQIAATLQNGFIADRVARNDDGSVKMLSPEGSDWNCAYCAFRTVCSQDGPGMIWVNDSSLTVRKGSDNGQGN
jgi:hypothetical protein